MLEHRKYCFNYLLSGKSLNKQTFVSKTKHKTSQIQNLILPFQKDSIKDQLTFLLPLHFHIYFQKKI